MKPTKLSARIKELQIQYQKDSFGCNLKCNISRAKCSKNDYCEDCFNMIQHDKNRLMSIKEGARLATEDILDLIEEIHKDEYYNDIRVDDFIYDLKEKIKEREK